VQDMLTNILSQDLQSPTSGEEPFNSSQTILVSTDRLRMVYVLQSPTGGAEPFDSDECIKNR